MTEGEVKKVIPLRLWSYTRAEKDEFCRRARYYAREFGGTGIVPLQSGWHLVYGNIMHKGLEMLAKAGWIDIPSLRDVLAIQGEAAGLDQTAIKNWQSILEGHLRGFQIAVWPQLMAEYEVVDTEKWIEWENKPGFKFRARQDLLLKNRFNGSLCYVDYKSTSSTKPQWIASWAKNVQLHSSMYALKMSTGIEVQNALVIGLYKGYDDKKNNIQRSVFSHGYVNREFPMSPEYKYEYQRSRGWEIFSTGEEFADLGDWIANMPRETLIEQFPQTGPIFPRDDIAQKYFRQQLIREAEVADALDRLKVSTSIEEIEDILDTHFKQNFSHCEPAWGFPCEYRGICWTPWILADPLGSGQFKLYESDLDVE